MSLAALWAWIHPGEEQAEGRDNDRRASRASNRSRLGSTDEGDAFEDATTANGSHADAVQEKYPPKEVPVYGRKSLPSPAFSRSDFSVWSILKQCIGKDLSRITMPVVFNEPLSFLQRVTEYLEYAHLLEKASSCEDPLLRLQYVSAFAVSATASNYSRISKPFNPLLGETYELDMSHSANFRICCEQVSHHPPVSAFYADSSVFKFHGAIHPKLKFWGKSVEAQPKGVVCLELLKHNEVYTWHYADCMVNNIIIGKITLEHCGSMEVTNHKTGDRCVMNFRTMSKDAKRVEGHIFNRKNKKLRVVYGRWTHFLKSCDVDGYENYLKEHGRRFSTHLQYLSNPSSRNSAHSHMTFEKDAADRALSRGFIEHLHVPGSVLLWEADPRPDNSVEMYNFTSFAMMLNEFQSDAAKTLLPKTDSRLRPDIRLLENGEVDGAADEKLRLEEKQRDARRERKKAKEEWEPVWFEPGANPYTKEETWCFKDTYWDRDWSNTPNIY